MSEISRLRKATPCQGGNRIEKLEDLPASGREEREKSIMHRGGEKRWLK